MEYWLLTLWLEGVLKIKSERIPALLLGFRRIDTLLECTEMVLESGVTHLYLAVDGPRDFGDRSRQSAIVAGVIKLSDLYKVPLRILCRSRNLGLSVAVVSAIDWFFSYEENGMIFEDDLEISPDLISFLTNSLNRFEDDDDVWLISGNQFFESQLDLTDNQWCNYPLIWGWATWKRKWLDIRSSLTQESLTFKVSARYKIKAFLRVGKHRVNRGYVDSWAIPFASGMRSQGKYCFMPPVNLASNIGVDAIATHTRDSGWHLGRRLGILNTEIELTSAHRACSAEKINRLIEAQVYNVGWKSVLSLGWIVFSNAFTSSLGNTMEKKLEDARHIGRELE